MCLLGFSNFDFEEFFGFGDDSNPLMMLIWIIPIIIFIFYGQRIQLQITSGEIKKSLKKLEKHRNESKTELIEYIKNNLKPKKDPVSIIDKFLDYFTIMPVDMDPNGIVAKVRHFVRSREDYTREHVRSLSPSSFNDASIIMIASSFCFDITDSMPSPGLPTEADGPSAFIKSNFLPSYSV